MKNPPNCSSENFHLKRGEQDFHLVNTQKLNLRNKFTPRKHCFYTENEDLGSGNFQDDANRQTQLEIYYSLVGIAKNFLLV